MPQLQSILASIMFFLMLPCLPSCNNNMVQPKNENVSIFEQPEIFDGLEADAEEIRKNIGEVHNNIIKKFYAKKPGKIGEKIPLEDFCSIFAEAVNKEFKDRDLQVRINEVDVDWLIQRMTEFIEDTGIDFFNPRTVNLPEALDKLASKGYITPEDASQCKHITKCLEGGANPSKDDTELLTATLLSENVRVYTDISSASYDLWITELHELYPDLEWSWPDVDWNTILDKICVIGCDALGAIAGGLLFVPSVVGLIIAVPLITAVSSIACEIAIDIIRE